MFHFTPWGIFGWCCRDQEDAFEQYQPNHIEQLRIFENEMLNSMTKAQKEAQRQTVDGQIRDVREKITTMTERVESLQTLHDLSKKDQKKDLPDVVFRMMFKSGVNIDFSDFLFLFK